MKAPEPVLSSQPVEVYAAALASGGAGLRVTIEVPERAGQAPYGPEEEALAAAVEEKKAVVKALQREYADVRAAIEQETLGAVSGERLLALQRRSLDLPLLILVADRESVEAEIALAERITLRLQEVKLEGHQNGELREAEEAVKAATVRLLRVRRIRERARHNAYTATERLRNLRNRHAELTRTLAQAASGGGKFTRQAKY